MITQVSGFNAGGVARDPRRKAQSIQFKRQSKIPYKSANNSAYAKEFKKQQKHALGTSVAIVAGSVLFTVGYFMLSGLKTMRHVA